MGYNWFYPLFETQDLLRALKWSPNVEFDIKPVLDVDQAIESIKKVAAAAAK